MESVDLFVNKLLFVTKDPLRSSHDLTKKICRLSPGKSIKRVREYKVTACYRINTRARPRKNPVYRILCVWNVKKVKSQTERKVKKLRFEADCIVPSGFPPPGSPSSSERERGKEVIWIFEREREVRTQKGLGNNDINRREWGERVAAATESEQRAQEGEGKAVSEEW